MSGVPNETMSSATLFFFSFLPICICASGPCQFSEIGRHRAKRADLDERSLRVLDWAADKDDDPLSLVLVLPVLERKLRVKIRTAKPGPGVSTVCRRSSQMHSGITHLSHLDSGRQVGLAGRLEPVQRRPDFSFVCRQGHEDFRSARKWTLWQKNVSPPRSPGACRPSLWPRRAQCNLVYRQAPAEKQGLAFSKALVSVPLGVVIPANSLGPSSLDSLHPL